MAKPRRSYALDTLSRRGKVRVLSDAAALAGIDTEGHVLEGWVAGRGPGVSLLARDGRILQAFEHHRVREDAMPAAAITG